MCNLQNGDQICPSHLSILSFLPVTNKFRRIEPQYLIFLGQISPNLSTIDKLYVSQHISNHIIKKIEFEICISF